MMTRGGLAHGGVWLAWAFLLVSTAVGYEKTLLSEKWIIQPAVSPETMPVESNGWLSANIDWRHNGGAGRGTTWQKVVRGSIHSLWYEQSFSLSQEQAVRQLLLDFARIEGDAIVFLNGDRVGELLRPGGLVEITGRARAGENQLRLFVTRDYMGISRAFEKDPLRYLSRGREHQKEALGKYALGITADVSLLTLPNPVGLQDAFIQTSVRKKELAVSLDIRAISPANGLSAKVEILDAEGRMALTFIAPLPPVPEGLSVQTVRHVWTTPRLWEVEMAYLYRAKVSLLRDGQTIDAGWETAFGFREIWTEGRKLIVNGHPQRFRVEWTSFGITKNSLPMLKLLGRNFVYWQANTTMWWSDWPETPVFSEALLCLLDEEGVGLALPVPGVSKIRDRLISDPQLEADYRREMSHLLRHYRNHPSVLFWTVSMNSFNPKDAIYPQTIGQRTAYSHPQARVIEKARAIVLENDATRLVYGHADGNLGDLATSNFYPNWMPLQEREDYFEIWAEKGDMPYLAAEFASLYSGDWYKGKRLLMTEYAARIIGDRAYEQETSEALIQTQELGQGNRGHGNSLRQAVQVLPVFWEIERIHTEGTDRAWRTWGVQGWHYFNFVLGYGDPPERRQGLPPFNRYNSLQTRVDAKPDWANPAFDYYAKEMQTLLAYIAGSPLHTDKTHAYYSGTRVEKQAAFVWDGSRTRKLKGTWQCMREESGAAPLAEGMFSVTLNPGDIVFSPLTFMAPHVDVRTPVVLNLAINEEDVAGQAAPLVTDTFHMEIFPGPEKAKLSGQWALFDPAGTAKELASLGILTTPFVEGVEAGTYDLLLIASGALDNCANAPFTAKDIENGLRVVIFQQRPEVWEGFGLRTLEAAARHVFIREHGAAEMQGLSDRDLSLWAGTPAGFEEWKYDRAPDTQRAPKGSNRHVVAPFVLETPDVVGFTPVLVTEFDLAYSPLLRWQYGKGAVWFCSLDLLGRLDRNPAVARVTRQLVQTAAAYQRNTSSVCYVGDALGREHLMRLGCDAVAFSKTAPSNSLLVAGQESGLTTHALDALTGAGSRIFFLPQTAAYLQTIGQEVAERVFTQGRLSAEGVFCAVGPDLLRDRTASPTVLLTDPQALANGLIGQGWQENVLFCQADPQALQKRFPEGHPGFDSAALTVIRQRQLQARLLTALGASPSQTFAECVTTYVPAKPVYEALRHWQLLGPFYPDKSTGAMALDVAFPGETNAVAGDTNPNLNYIASDGRKLDFRQTAMAGVDGFVDVSAVLKPEKESVAYAVREVMCETPRTARLRLGFDYFGKVWVNGQLVYQVDRSHGGPRPNRFAFNVPLHKGLNIITLKIVAGAKGCGFWANLSRPGTNPEAEVSRSGGQSMLYDVALRNFDPYEYYYW